MPHPTTVLLDRTVSIDDYPLHVGSITADLNTSPHAQTRYSVSVVSAAEHTGRHLIGLGVGRVRRVGWSNWREIGGWGDLARRYCSTSVGYPGWGVTDEPYTLTQLIEVDSSDRDRGMIELCFVNPTFVVHGPWVLALPGPSGNAG